MSPLQRVREQTSALRAWSVTRDGVLHRVAGDWIQALALQRDRDRRGWFPNEWVGCLAIQDGPVLGDVRIVKPSGPLWTKDDLASLGPAFLSQARPDPTKTLDASAVFSSFDDTERLALAAPKPLGDEADPRVLLCVAAHATRSGNVGEALAAIARARRSPSAGGLSATWDVTAWAADLAERLTRGLEDASTFLDATREASLEELG